MKKSMMQQSSGLFLTAGIPITLDGLTFLVLLILKLTKLTDISWFWVLFPLWIVPVAVFVLAFVLGFMAVFFKRWQKCNVNNKNDELKNEWKKKVELNKERKKNE